MRIKKYFFGILDTSQKTLFIDLKKNLSAAFDTWHNIRMKIKKKTLLGPGTK